MKTLKYILNYLHISKPNLLGLLAAAIGFVVYAHHGNALVVVALVAIGIALLEYRIPHTNVPFTKPGPIVSVYDPLKIPRSPKPL